VGSLDHLWAGWRSEFVSGGGSGAGGGAGSVATGTGTGIGPGQDDQDDRGAPEQHCVFCAILASNLPDEELNIIWRHPGGRVIALLNAYPYTSGHLMAMPVRHVPELEDLEPEESAELWQTVAAGVRALKAAYKPDGINIGANLGRAAGAGVPGHFHMHVLGRWVGDTNFMTAVADARVLPEPLGETAAKLRTGWPPG